MNFEQNFSPLDPNSEEYQSLDSFGQELDPLAPKKPKTIPGTNVPIGGTGIPFTKVDKPFTQIENSIKSVKAANTEYQNLLAKKGGASSVYGEAPGDEIERNKQFTSALKSQSDELLKKYSNDINKPIDQVISSGKWEEYITESGGFNYDKARGYFDYVVKQNGGGTYVRDLMISKFQNAIVAKKNEKDVKPFLKEEIAKTGLNLDKDGNVDFASIIGTENLKAGQEAKLKSIAPAQFNKLQLIESDSEKQVNQLLDASKDVFKQEELKFNTLKQQVQAQLTSGQITQEEAQNTINDALAGINQMSESLNNDFQKAVRDIRVKTSSKYARISKEIGAIGSGMSLDDIISGLPKDKQKEVRARVEAAKGKVNLAYENAYSKLSSTKNEGKKIQESMIGLGGLAGKSFLSGWNNGLASLGGYLNMNGIDNSFADWLRAHSTTGEELAPAQYEWSGKEWYKRGISSAMQSTGMSLPTMAPTLAITAAGTAAGVPAVGLAVINGVLGYLGERNQNSFEVYDKEIKKGGNPNDALIKAETFERMSVSELPFHLLGGLADVKLFQLGASATKSAGKGVKSIVTEYGKSFGGELLEEYPTELLQNYNQAKLDGYKGSLFEYGASNPELFLDTLVSTLGQGSVFAGAGKVFGAFTSAAPESRIQFYTDMIQKNGIEYAKTVAKKYYDSGILDGATATSVSAEIEDASKIYSDLLESGLDDNAAKLYVAMHYQSKSLSSKADSKKESVMGSLAKLQLANTQSQMKELANGTLPYVVMEIPGGENSSRVISLQDFNTLTPAQKTNVIQASNSISVINDENANNSLQEQKQQLGNTPNAPQGLFTNNIKPIQDATQEITGQEQISTEQGGISQYQGTQPVQEQATNEAKDSNRPISGQAQFQVGQQDVGVYKKETSAIANKMNDIGGAAVEFTSDASINATSKSNVATLTNREGVVKTPNSVSITDFNGIPMMVTISDELTTGAIVNPETGNTIDNLNGGIGFNYSEGNTEFAWAYTDEKTATDTLNSAKNIYQANKQLFDNLWAEGKLPQNHIPVAVVKMGVDAITSNEAVFRVLSDNVSSLPQANQKTAYKALVADIKNRLDITQKAVDEVAKSGKAVSPSLNNALNGYKSIYNEYLKQNKDIKSVIDNIGGLNINTRPLITDRVTIGQVGLLPKSPKVTQSTVPVVKALLNGLPQESARKLHLGYITEPLRDSSIKDVPARHVIGFVGIDVSKDAPVQTSTHKNYPYALSGQGLGVVENTAHIASVMPTAYGNVVSKITDAVAKDGSITPGEAVSRALPSGLANAIFKNKTLATNDNLSKLIGFLNLSFPDVTFFTDKQSFQDVLSSEGVKEYLKDGDVIYGVTKDGNIYLNPEIATYNTAIHEMGHIWVDFIENTNPALFAQGLKLVEGTKEFESAKARLGDTVFARKEALAMLIGNRGETIADAAMQSQFKEWLVGVWKYLQEIFPNLRKLTPQQIETLSLSDFLGGALQDILSGKPISTQKAEYIAAESQFQMGEKPSWFDDTPGSQKITVTQDFINENPAFVDAIKNDLLLINKKKWTGTAQGLKDAINELVDSGTFNLDAQQLRNAIVRVYKATPKSKANISKTIAMAESIEKMHSLFTDKAIEVNKQELKKSIVNNNEYNDAEKQIILGMIEDIIPENVFLFINESATDAKKSKDNYYEFSTNLLKSKKPSAFIHEVGHWGFFNILTPQERIEFFKYSAERFAKGEAKLEDEQVFGKPFKATREMPDGSIETATMQTNATEDFMEYFAEQFRQYYIENKITDAQFDTLFKKISLVLDKILDLFRKTGYNKELVKYFDKIIDARPKKEAAVQEAQQETGIVKAEPVQPSTEVSIIPPTEVGMPEEQQEPSGLPEKKKYSWEKGTSGKPEPGETMIKTSTGRYVAIETMAGQMMDRDKVVNEIKKATPSNFTKQITKLRTKWRDNQYRVLKSLSEIGKNGMLVKFYLLTRNSASATATALAESAVKQIYGDMSKKKKFNINGAKITEYVLFNQIINYQRVISIQEQMNDAYKTMISSEPGSQEYNKAKKKLLDNNMIDVDGNYVGESLDTEFAMGNVTATQSKALLYEIRESIGEEAFDKLMTASEKYSNHFNEMMKERYKAGLISEDTYKYLSKFYYAPGRYISDVLLDPILSIAKKTVSHQSSSILKMRSLAGGTERLSLNDYEGLLRAVTYSSEYSIAENRATNRFYDLISKNKEQFNRSGIRLGTKLVPIESEGPVKFDIIDEKVIAIQEGREKSALELPSGQKQLPYKGMQKPSDMTVGKYIQPIDIVLDDDGNKFRVVFESPKAGEDIIKTYYNGQQYDIIVPEWFADQWYNRNMTPGDTSSLIAKITGANVLRLVATGINPIFGIAQIVPDTISAYASTLEERKLPLLIDYPRFFIKTLAASRDIIKKTDDFKEATKYGATTNFYNGGSVSFERGLMGLEDKSLEKVLEEWNVPVLKQYVMGSKRITETTEQMTKVAIYKEIRDRKIKEFKEENNREPDSQELEDIKIEAGSMARGTADFHRKGSSASNVNKVIPYLNAAIQINRAVLRSIKNNPMKAVYYAMEYMGHAAVFSLMAMGAGDDDELKEKKRKAYLGLTEFERDNSFLMYFNESEGKFVAQKLPSFLVPLNSLSRRLVERIYLERKEVTEKDIRDIIANVVDMFPLLQMLNVEKTLSRNPAYSFVSKLFFNKDPYRQEAVAKYDESTKDYLEGAMIGKEQSSAFSRKVGELTKNGVPFFPEGMSPKRLDAALGSIPFQSNPISALPLFLADASNITREEFEEKYGKNTASIILSASGISKRYFKGGSRINQNLAGLSLENMKDRGEMKNKIAEMILPKFEEFTKNMTREDAFVKATDEFISNEFEKLTVEQKLIAQGYINGDLRGRIFNVTKDKQVSQILNMEDPNAKIDAILYTMKNVRTTDSSRDAFINELVQNGITANESFGRMLAVRGEQELPNPETGVMEKNNRYEKEVGELLKKLTIVFQKSQ